MELFKEIRWSDNKGEPICPHCGNQDKHYFLKSRKIWKCAICRKQYNITSGTVFAYHKLPLQDYLNNGNLY